MILRVLRVRYFAFDLKRPISNSWIKPITAPTAFGSHTCKSSSATPYLPPTQPSVRPLRS